MENFNGILCNSFVNWITIKKRYWINSNYIKYIDIKWFERIKQYNSYEITIGHIYIARNDNHLGHCWTLLCFGIHGWKIEQLALFGIWFVSSWCDPHPPGSTYDVRKVLWHETKVKIKSNRSSGEMSDGN